ncbi:DUF4893 domain-containing protein [Sphingomonas piscis]|uniref:DUF4893 domain-containing protein n=1 Tax=Sphingomonas piscis TaxID=2714943 RepID=A0A6G7YNE7_9SPHN|nr:DUF4893 domain-containing protein [Sphingomonas piscis]QIK78261.1 DUF4893 domain-containing protein [Sphingomonas piscis]
MRRLLPLAAFAATAGCTAATTTAPPQPVASPLPAWRSTATEDDRLRLRNWRSSFSAALAAARRSGHGAAIDREGSLLQPDSALGGGPIPAGDYRCRVIKLGARSQGLLDYVAYPYFRCRVGGSGTLQSFSKLTGSQRVYGRIYPGDTLRQVFLGTLVLGDETAAMRYGADRERDVAGLLERIGPARWRMVMPRPHFESLLDVLELVPAQ